MTSAATAAGQVDFTGHWVGFLAIAIFCAAYALVFVEETIHLRKSKPVIVAAGAIWILVGAAFASQDLSDKAAAALHHVLLEFAELLLFLIVALTYVNALQERQVFEALRSWLVRSGFSYRSLFWLTGGLAFFLSPLADNLTTALVMCSVATAVGYAAPRFVTVSCINIVVAANAGGAFSPFGDITTLMVWQKGVVAFAEFFALFIPSLVNFLIPAALMHAAIPSGRPPPSTERVSMQSGAVWVIVLFGVTVAMTVCVHSFLHLSTALGMMTGLGLLMLYDFMLQRRARRTSTNHSFEVFRRLAGVEWDTLLFFYGVMMCVGALGLLGYLTLVSGLLYNGLGPTTANILIGVASAIFDNIPLMFAVLTMQPEMSHGQWLLITLTAGVGGSLLSIGSAAGVALMGQARGTYTFAAHLRWAPAILLGYAASIAVHMWLNRSLF
ncbi:MAG: sodium:proton antiporter NhaD [Acetobacteraceae bacterium]